MTEKTLFRFRLATAGIVVLLVAGTAVADDWPCWRGPTHDGISVETGWSPAALKSAKILWRANVGKGHSTVVVVDDRAYTMGNGGNEDTVFCFDGKTGKILWSTSYPCASGSYPGPRGTPTVDGKLVYTMSREGHLHCLDAATGAVKWDVKVETDLPKWGLATSPMVHGDLVVMNVGAAGAAFEKSTGKPVWGPAKGTPGYASPVFSKAAGGFLVFSSKGLVCVDAKSGKPRWSQSWLTKYDVNAADPVLVGRTGVFISSGYNTGGAMLQVSPGGAREVWKNRNMRNHMASTILLDGHLYGFDETSLACIDVKKGETRWSVSGFDKGGLTLADGKLIVLSEKGIDLAIAEASPKGFEEIARARVLTGHTWTAPVLSNGRIYCRNDAGDIACVDVTGK